MPQTTKRKPVKKRRRKKRRSHYSRTAAIAIGIVLLFLILAFWLLGRYVRQLTSAVSEAVPEVSVSTEPGLPPSTLSAQCFGSENGYRTYVSDTLTAKLGADLSSHQGSIDWDSLTQSPIDFVILRAGYRGYTDGSINIDSSFAENLAAARNAGLGVGVYFFSQALTTEEAEAEAQTVLSQLADYQIDYPIYYDWEPISEGEARTDTISSSEITACAQHFCQIIENAGYKAGIYFNLDIAQNYYPLSALQNYEFWLAEYQDTPSYPYDFGMWQYTESGTLPGVSTPVDLNLCFKAYEN